MGHFFFGLFRFFSTRKTILWATLGIILGLSAFLASHIRMHEEISKTLSQGSGDTHFEEVVRNARLADKLIIRIFPADSTAPANPSGLITYAYSFIDTLRHDFDSTYIESITPDPSDTIVQYFLSLVSANLPVYLDQEDYSVMDSLTRPEVIRDLMGKNYRLLATPAGSHSDTSGGVYLVDVSDPTQPNIIDQAIVPGTTRSVTVLNNVVYAGDSASTLDQIPRTISDRIGT